VQTPVTPDAEPDWSVSVRRDLDLSHPNVP
jgi:hypothetical protein